MARHKQTGLFVSPRSRKRARKRAMAILRIKGRFLQLTLTGGWSLAQDILFLSATEVHRIRRGSRISGQSGCLIATNAFPSP